MSHFRAQVNFRQLTAEVTSNRYLRKILPAAVRSIFAFLHAPVLQCGAAFRSLVFQLILVPCSFRKPKSILVTVLHTLSMNCRHHVVAVFLNRGE